MFSMVPDITNQEQFCKLSICRYIICIICTIVIMQNKIMLFIFFLLIALTVCNAVAPGITMSVSEQGLNNMITKVRTSTK